MAFDRWPNQILAMEQAIDRFDRGIKKFCISSVTGSGKSFVLQDLCTHAVIDRQWQVALFTNRKLLTNQLAQGLIKSDIHFGVRAAGFESWTDANAPIQICSAPTEVSRVLKARSRAKERLATDEEVQRDYKLFPAQLVLIDEAHLLKGSRMQEIIREYRDLYDAYIVGVTATPLGIGGIYDELIVVSNNSQMRDCGALVLAESYEPVVMDMSKIYKAKHELPSQEAMEKEVQSMWTQHLVGSIFEHWKKLNPEEKATIGFAPGVKESLGLAHEFWKKGVGAAHISGSGLYMNGKEYKSTAPEDRDEIFAKLKDGSVKAVFNRFVCLDAETQILTEDGWASIGEVTLDSKVANWDNGRIYFECPHRVIRRKRDLGERMVVLETPRRSIRVTENHELVYQKYPRGPFCKATAAELVGRRALLPVNGVAEPSVETIQQPVMPDGKRLSRMVTAAAYAARERGDDASSSRTQALERLEYRYSKRFKLPNELTIEECELIGFWVGDGNASKKKKGVEYRLFQTAKTPSIVGRINQLLESIPVDFKVSSRPVKLQSGVLNGNTVHAWSLPQGNGTGKNSRRGIYHLTPYLKKDGTHLLWGLSKEQFEAYLRGLWMADGFPHNDNISPPGRFQICGANRKLFDVLQAIATCRGYRTSIRSLRASTEKHKQMLLFTITKKQEHDMTKYRLRFEEGWKDEEVWCVTTTSGNIVTRRKGSATVMGNCREAIDLPVVECLILATPIGSLLSYIQMIGRGLRASPSTGKQSCTVIDHCGNIYLHGSPNMDRDEQWKKYFHENEEKITKDRLERLRDPDDKTPEPITCPECGRMRLTGTKCLNCGFEHSTSVRYIIQEDGTLRPSSESRMPKRKVKCYPSTAKKWEQCYWRCHNSKKKDFTFTQVRALFIKENFYSPPTNLPLMPKHRDDWTRTTKAVTKDRLRQKGE